MSGFDLLSQIDQNLSLRKVGIEEFCESDEFCGKLLYPRQKLLLKIIFLEELTGREEDILTYWMNGGRNGEILISPYIRERMDWCRSRNYKHFREVVLVGGRRASKGFVTGMAMAKKLYDTMILQDPGKHYRIDPDKEIYFSCVAASQDQAKKYQYADFSSAVGGCVAMQNYITKLQELEFSVATEADKTKIAAARAAGLKLGRDISKLRGAAFAANASTIRGSATIALVMDEMAHMQQEGESAATADQVYEAAIPALAQFGKDAIVFCNSSPYTKLGKFYERYQAALRDDEENPGNPGAPNSFAFQYPSWALFEGWQEDPLHRFSKCITVSPDWDVEQKTDEGEYYHSEEDREAIEQARREEQQNPDTYKVERRAQFAEVLEAYLRPEMVDRCFAGRPMPNGEFFPIQTNFDSPQWIHRYKCHIDPSSTTAGFGFAMGHTEELEDQFGNQATHVVFDVVKRWNPKEFPDGVIDWEVVLREVFGYVNAFRPYEVTFDQFNSAAPIQWLNRICREHNLDTRVYEKTATSQSNWNRAEIFRTALYQGLVHSPYDTADTEYAAMELKYLQQINTSGKFPRIDKQDIGPVQTKDMADCMMDVVESLIGNKLTRQNRDFIGGMPMALGAAGGFALGGIHSRGRPDNKDFSQLGGTQRVGEQRVQGARERLSALNDPARRQVWGTRRRFR